MAADIDWETCSWCCAEVMDHVLTEQPDGARICPACVDEAKFGARV